MSSEESLKTAVAADGVIVVGELPDHSTLNLTRDPIYRLGLDLTSKINKTIAKEDSLNGITACTFADIEIRKVLVGIIPTEEGHANSHTRLIRRLFEVLTDCDQDARQTFPDRYTSSQNDEAFGLLRFLAKHTFHLMDRNGLGESHRTFFGSGGELAHLADSSLDDPTFPSPATLTMFDLCQRRSGAQKIVRLENIQGIDKVLNIVVPESELQVARDARDNDAAINLSLKVKRNRLGGKIARVDGSDLSIISSKGAEPASDNMELHLVPRRRGRKPVGRGKGVITDKLSWSPEPENGPESRPNAP